ncbi:hypothetical protein XCV2224 [Xanthomonas euvesicatoria pv. vesicatoria str. 85-10]|uniref:Uncharacterized protein n=1 Tax=Xanthomonas euvesicatoria pv. vesicatoria (strain 85-10) TaxID=316273 RepID=Q3BTF8_XANE5|nr:hypothetical protein XCV2224 [Xanthomonas euvesicatoria pv. vesicatoria str. 85-10]
MPFGKAWGFVDAAQPARLATVSAVELIAKTTAWLARDARLASGAICLHCVCVAQMLIARVRPSTRHASGTQLPRAVQCAGNG